MFRQWYSKRPTSRSQKGHKTRKLTLTLATTLAHPFGHSEFKCQVFGPLGYIQVQTKPFGVIHSLCFRNNG